MVVEVRGVVIPPVLANRMMTCRETVVIAAVMTAGILTMVTFFVPSDERLTEMVVMALIWTRSSLIGSPALAPELPRAYRVRGKGTE